MLIKLIKACLYILFNNQSHLLDIMNETNKISMTDQLQKAITRNCYIKCKTLKDSQCFQTCYNKFVKTAAIVNSALKDLAYKNHSLFGYKGYPEHTIQSAYFYDEDVFWNVYGAAPMTSNRDYAA